MVDGGCGGSGWEGGGCGDGDDFLRWDLVVAVV